MPSPIISLDNISLRWGQRSVLSQVCLDINYGDFVAITGPNGGGKTSLLRLILKLLHPTTGTVVYHADPTTGAKPRFGYLPQKTSIDSHFPITVNEVVASGLIADKSLTRQQRNERIDRAIALLDLEHRRHFTIGQISGGQLQRTLIARAIISQPDVLVLDEPLSYLDKQSEQRIYDIIASLADHTTIIFVSHEMSRVAAMANRHLIVDRHVEECHAGHHYVPLDCECPHPHES